jgi:hypothetical protein
MARFFSIQIGSLYLTSTGASSGTPCKVRVLGQTANRLPSSGNLKIAADGAPVLETINLGEKSRRVEIQIEYITKTVLDSLVASVETAVNSNSTIRVQGTGDTGNFDYDCLPFLPDWITDSGEFSSSIVKGVTVRFIAT